MRQLEYSSDRPGSLVIDFDFIYSTTGRRGPKWLSHKQYERIATRLFSRVTKRVQKLIFGESDFQQRSSFWNSNKDLLSGMFSEDFSLRRTGEIEFEFCSILCEDDSSCKTSTYKL